jgi:hypothetical protein
MLWQNRRSAAAHKTLQQNAVGAAYCLQCAQASVTRSPAAAELCSMIFLLFRYEGATAAALPEAIQINQGGSRGRRKTVVANSMITSSTPAVPKVGKHGSLASTAQPVSALALSGKQHACWAAHRTLCCVLCSYVTGMMHTLQKLVNSSK